ncbi:MAG: hypothetical protein FRX48_06282 [Lasallia pustulata]|uniref:DNA endonuclease activator Ctp1 C-terminal domain-containing protein n=1 Tax=Lasallia pustulata TaxID=136370 RepID=A0A5M8PKT7_9LECA|nr:MAG: hypothetical protein FRX48_06282 [Lasallia pustulata]
MEAHMDALEKHRIALLNLLSNECAAYELMLKEDLAQRFAVQASEQQQRREELDVLRQQALRAKQLEVESLEVENGELRRKLSLVEMRGEVSNDSSNWTNLPRPGSPLHDRASGVYLENNLDVTPKQQCVSYEEHESLKGDYGKLVVSHKTLQEKYRRAKEISKAWRKYDDKQKQRQAEKRMRREIMDDLRHTAMSDEGHGHIESAQPPNCSNKTVYTPGSLRVTPEPCSPRREAIASVSQVQRYEISGAKPAAYVEIDQGDQLVNGPTANGVSAHVGQGDVTQTSDESTDPQVELQLQSKNPQEKGLKGRIPDVPQADECSDCPVVISERPVKRKRPIPAAIKQGAKFHEDCAMPPGCVTKPIRVKSEQNSSSPVVQVALDDLPEVQDTLDLDEIGDRALTPRKRRRLQQLLVRPQGINLPAPSVTQSDREQQVNIGYEDICAEYGDQRGTMVDQEDDRKDHRLPRDMAYFAKLGDEHGQKLWEEEQRKVKSRQDAQATLDAIVPKRLRGSQKITLARQWLHNHRAHARHAKAVEGQQAQFGNFQEATPPQPARHDVGRGNGIQWKVMSEQAARASSKPIEALKSEKQLNSATKSGHVIRPAVLRPTHPNAQLLPRTSEQPIKKRLQPPSRRDRGAAQIPSLGEDGEGDDNADEATEIMREKRITDGSKLSRNSKAIDLHYRLDTLLAEPSREKPPLASENAGKPSTSLTGAESIKAQSFSHNPSRTKTNGKASLTADTEAPSTPQLVTQKNGALEFTPQLPTEQLGYPTPTTLIAKRPLTQHLPAVEAPSAELPEDEPLRARPLRRLRLDDFKVNPACNQGYDYAFDEVVRNRDQRKCLPNCTRPECCGAKFQKFVELGGFVTPRKPGLWSSSPVDEGEEEVRLLEEYLGYDRTRITGLPEDEKRQLVNQAKANQFANEHGRHRQAYERNPSPPGFWRTDMPTTQELEEDREAAQQMMRRKVEERHREAMRSGGRWMFRDE